MAAALQPQARDRWDDWRQRAWHVLDVHASSVDRPDRTLRERLDLIRSANIRRGWYARPDLFPFLEGARDTPDRL